MEALSTPVARTVFPALLALAALAACAGTGSAFGIAFDVLDESVSTEAPTGDGAWMTVRVSRSGEIAVETQDGATQAPPLGAGAPAPADPFRVLDPVFAEVAPVADLAQIVIDATPALEPLVVEAPAPAAPAPARAPATPAAAAAPAPAAADEVPPLVGATVLAATAAVAIGWASGLGASVAAHAKKGLALLGLAGYTRLTRDHLLDHEERDRLYNLVRERPGTSMNALVEASGAARNTVTYHLRVLEREGLVSSSREGRRRFYFPTGQAGPGRPESAAFAALAHDTTRSIAESVRATPGIDQRTLCERLALPPSLAHWHVDRLETAGLVKRLRDGRHVRYYPGPEAGRFL